MKKIILTILTVICFTLLSCEKDNFTAETYFPKNNDKIEKVVKYWGNPNSLTSSKIGETYYSTYYYDNKRVIVYFVNFRVDGYTIY